MAKLSIEDLQELVEKQNDAISLLQTQMERRIDFELRLQRQFIPAAMSLMTDLVTYCEAIQEANRCAREILIPNLLEIRTKWESLQKSIPNEKASAAPVPLELVRSVQ